MLVSADGTQTLLIPESPLGPPKIPNCWLTLDAAPAVVRGGGAEEDLLRPLQAATLELSEGKSPLMNPRSRHAALLRKNWSTPSAKYINCPHSWPPRPVMVTNTTPRIRSPALFATETDIEDFTRSDSFSCSLAIVSRPARHSWAPVSASADTTATLSVLGACLPTWP